MSYASYRSPPQFFWGNTKLRVTELRSYAEATLGLLLTISKCKEGVQHVFAYFYFSKVDEINHGIQITCIHPQHQDNGVLVFVLL